MTLIELVVAVSIFGAVITTAVAFAASQNSAFQTASQRMSALRNIRYSVTMLVQDIETLGTNVPSMQPTLIYAGADAITFSADYATNVAQDPFAVFYDRDAPSGQVRAASAPFTIPTTGVTAADTTYRVQGVLSPAEIITFFFAPDSATARGDDHILYRQINGGAPDAVARNLLRAAGRPFFSYGWNVADSLGIARLQAVPDSALPFYHESPTHLASADTGRAAWPDSLRSVELTLASTNGLIGYGERRVEMTRTIPLPNAGVGPVKACGSAPLLGVALTATAGTLAAGEPAIELTWDPATDEIGGEEDVVRYVLWRTENGASSWGDPYLAIPGGAATYTYTDAAVEHGGVYQFALAAQDCSPTLSPLVASNIVVVP